MRVQVCILKDTCSTLCAGDGAKHYKTIGKTKYWARIFLPSFCTVVCNRKFTIFIHIFSVPPFYILHFLHLLYHKCILCTLSLYVLLYLFSPIQIPTGSYHTVIINFVHCCLMTPVSCILYCQHIFFPAISYMSIPLDSRRFSCLLQNKFPRIGVAAPWTSKIANFWF